MSSLKSFKLGELAEILEVELKGDSNKELSGMGSLENSTNEEISFIAKKSYKSELAKTQAGAVICSEEFSQFYEGNKLICSNPYLIYARCTRLFKQRPEVEKGISNLAEVHKMAKVSESACVSGFVTISSDATIGDNVVLMPGTFVGEGSVIGKDSIIYPNTSIYDHVEIGSDCIIHAGVVIGSDGLGFAKEDKTWVKIEHLGRVLIGNDVEIGSNSTIDRGSVGDTVIGNNVKIDNQVHIAHNVNIGENCVITGQVGFAGSSSIGSNVLVGGQAGISGHLKVGNNVQIGGGSGVIKNIPDNTKVMGYPAKDIRRFLKENK